MPLLDAKRLFIAIALPADVKSHLTALQGELKKSGADAKWVEPENIHLTLKFLGSVETKSIGGISEALTKHFASRKSFDVVLKYLGCFPSLHSPRVVWAGFQDEDKATQDIADLTDEAMTKFGFKKESREFQAHATLARVRSSRNKAALAEKIDQANQDFKPQTARIDNITLFESQLTPKGPTYTIVHQVKFL